MAGPDIRPLTVDDHEAAWRLAVEAFGGPPPGSDVPKPPTPDEVTGRHAFGVWDDGRLIARAVGLDFASWFGGVRVPTCGVASVAVATEHRGRGLLRPLMAALLADARTRGHLVSTLFPTANGIYRSLGFELIASYDTIALATTDLPRSTPAGIRTRRATADDLPAVRATYERWARLQHGPLTRTGPRFPETDAVLDEVSGITLAVDDDDAVVGYAIWERGQGYDRDAVLTVHDLVALRPDASRALWAAIATFSSVTGTVRLSSSGDDLARFVLPTAHWDVVARHPYALRVLDVAGALTARALETRPGIRTVVDLAVEGDALGELDGTYRITVGGDTTGRCEAVEPELVADDVPTFTPQGLALAWAGAQSCGNLRLLGHLTGHDHHDRFFEAVLGARQLHIRDYF